MGKTLSILTSFWCSLKILQGGFAKHGKIEVKMTFNNEGKKITYSGLRKLS